MCSFCMKMEPDASATTFLNGFVTSLRFCHFVFGMRGAEEPARSRRVVGVARTMYLTKRKKDQKPPLTVAMVKTLEDVTCDSV